MALGGARCDVERAPPLSTVLGQSLGCSELACLSVKWDGDIDLIGSHQE